MKCLRRWCLPHLLFPGKSTPTHHAELSPQLLFYFLHFRNTITSIAMESFQPFIKDIRVDATWSGDVSEPVSLEVSIDVVVKSRSHLPLIQNNHPSVLSAQLISIRKLVRNNEVLPPCSPSSCRAPAQQEAFGSATPFANPPNSANQQHKNPLVHGFGQASMLIDLETQETSDTVKGKAKYPFVPSDQQESLADTPEVVLFAQTASLYDATSSRDSVLSPPPPLTSKKLTIPKRRGFEPNSPQMLNRLSPRRQTLIEKDDSSPLSRQKRPVSLDKRPPWRPVGAEDTTQRGRKQLGTDVAQRRISRSAGMLQAERGRTRRRQSSLPGPAIKPERGLQNKQAAEHLFNAQTLPRGRLTKVPMRTTPRDRDTTVKVTRYAEALNASERLEKWLEDRRNQWPSEILSPDELVSDHDGSFPIQSSNSSSGPALSPSPTPSSRAALPWTSIRGIRGGGFIDGTYVVPSEGGLIPTLVDDNGTLYVYFHGDKLSDPKPISFRIKIYVSLKLEAQASGCHSLAIPGLPLQNGKSKGTFTLAVAAGRSLEDDSFKAYEKVAYVDDDFATHPLQHDQICHNFPLDKPFSIKLLCFEDCRELEKTDFEIDSDVRTRYGWEDLEGDGITAEHSMICSLRLHPFLMWAENVKFKLYLIGGPSGILETSLNPGNRRLYLDGKRCDAEHELEISLTCPVADLQKTFTISWDQSMGVAPFEVWLPRISGLYRKKLEDVFDLPDENGISVAPRPCKKSRVYSMSAQERFLKSSGEVFFFPENQHTPGTIQKGLMEQSGQFYDELTAENSDAASETPGFEDCVPPPKNTFITLQPNKRTRTEQSNLLGNIITDFGHQPVKTVALGKEAEKLASQQVTGESMGITSIEAGPHGRKYFLTRIALFGLEALRWFFRRLVFPARLLKILILLWLCFRAFDNAKVVQVENSFISSAKAAWDRWDFEPVQLHGDFTGWKHLMAKVDQGAARIIHDRHVGVLTPMDVEPEENEETETVEGNDDRSVTETSNAQESMQVPEEQSEESLSSSGTENGGDETLTLLDRIDLALGWKPPAGGR
jgi:hypothetical protein